jgi:hypothetical protein
MQRTTAVTLTQRRVLLEEILKEERERIARLRQEISDPAAFLDEWSKTHFSREALFPNVKPGDEESVRIWEKNDDSDAW